MEKCTVVMNHMCLKTPIQTHANTTHRRQLLALPNLNGLHTGTSARVASPFLGFLVDCLTNRSSCPNVKWAGHRLRLHVDKRA